MGTILNIQKELTQRKFSKKYNEIKTDKMKRLLILIMYVPLISLSQEGFEFVYEDTMNVRCISSFSDNQNFIISLGYVKNPTTNLYDALIVMV